MKLKTTINWLYVEREAAKFLMVFAGIFLLVLPEAWAEGGEPFLLVMLAMVGVLGIIRGLWEVVCDLDDKINAAECRIAEMERRQREAEQRRREAKMRAAAAEEERQREWRRYFAEQERWFREERENGRAV